MQDGLLLALVENAKVLLVESGEDAPVLAEHCGIDVHQRDAGAESDGVLRAGQGGGAEHDGDRTHDALDSRGRNSVPCVLKFHRRIERPIFAWSFTFAWPASTAPLSAR